MIKVLVTGAGGQLGRELQRSAPGHFSCRFLRRQELDISQRDDVKEALVRFEPDVVINAAAYTAVDRAESEPELAQRINADGSENLAMAARSVGARLLHVSTDFVFSGQASIPYIPSSDTSPSGQYGRSKLLGEQRIQALLPEAVILRTAWVYSAFGNNFVKTMLRLMNERQELGVVQDQLGTPTWARGLATVLWELASVSDAPGVYHWTDSGQCSWYEFALAICEEGAELGLVRGDVRIKGITTAEYPTAASRPAYSVLDNSATCEMLGHEGRPWRGQLVAMLVDLKEQREMAG